MRSVQLVVCLFLLASVTGCVAGAGVTGPSVETISLGACNPLPCARVTIETLPELPDTFSGEARSAIRERVARALYAPLDDADGDVSRASFLKSVQTQYDEYMEVKDPQTVVDWQVARSASIIFANQDFASVMVRTEGYLGGAHGFSDEQMFVFDGKDGRALSWDDVLSPASKSIFMKAAEAEFRRARDIKPSQTLEEAGFTFENETFALSQNFAITDKGVSLHYNPYEVGPYVMGPTDVMVPLDVAAPAINTEVINLVRVAPRQGLL